MFDFKHMFSLHDKVALVTGAARKNGIGAHIAKALADFGATVILHGRKETQESQSIVDSLKNVSPDSTFVSEDLGLQGAGKNLIEKAEAIAPIDILVTNHSLQVLKTLTDNTPQDIEQQININLLTNIEILQSVLPKMAARGHGRVIHIGSINQERPREIVSVYAALKSAQHNLIQSLAQSYAQKGILLNTISPGLVDTYPENRNNDLAAQKQWDAYAAKLNWLGKAGSPSEIAIAAVFLASPLNTFMTGETININGGF